MSDAFQSPAAKLYPPAFEFTKRKQWAGLLITELADAVNLILGATGKIWYCGPAVHELLGWRDEELIERNLIEFVHAHDQNGLRIHFNHSIRSRTDFSFYARLRCKDRILRGAGNTTQAPPTISKEILFELKGYPHYIPGQNECKCFFLVAKPYPSKNTAMLNTFLELKMENERLQQRLMDLKARTGAVSLAGSIAHQAPYPVSSLIPTHEQAVSVPSQPLTVMPGTGYHRMSNTSDDMRPDAGPVPCTAADGQSGDDGSEQGRKKKLKKANAIEQHVCFACGQTDSPEWRKGPSGPKTLCNACGLRWAKKSPRRIHDDRPEDVGALQHF